MEITLTILFTLMGISVGSFLNVLIDRLPVGESPAYPPSHCADCQHPLAPKDIIPAFSYLWLRGHCRYCGAKIPPRILLVEILTGLVFLLAFWHYGLSAEFALTAIFASVFIAIIFIDKEHQIIPNKIIYPVSLVAIIIYGIDLLLPKLVLFPELTYLPQTKILSSLLGGAIGFIFFLIVYIIARGGMGAGDVKLAGLIGLVTGFPMVFLALFIGIVAGGLVAIVLLIFRIKGRKEALPYGAFLGIGPIVTLLWGNEILHWYLTLM